MIFPISVTKYKILKCIYEIPGIKISGLIKEVHASQKAAYKYLDELIKAEIITEELIGKKPLLRTFKPNLATEAGKICFTLLELQYTLDFFNKYPKFRGAFAQFKKETEKLIDTAVIFGSFARKTPTKESDIDIAVISKKINRKKIEDIAEKCFVTLKYRATIRTFNTQKFIQMLKNNDDFALQIMKNHIVIVNDYKWIEIMASV